MPAAVERGDVTAACEMILSDKEFSTVAADLPSLPEDVRRALMKTCAEMYASATSDVHRHHIPHMHALSSMSLGEPDDLLAAPRQEVLLEAGLNAHAQALGPGRDEIEELAVPAYAPEDHRPHDPRPTPLIRTDGHLA